MVAHMNAEALARTIETGDGLVLQPLAEEALAEGRGQRQHARGQRRCASIATRTRSCSRSEIAGDGVACHQGYRSCFYRTVPLGAPTDAGARARLRPRHAARAAAEAIKVSRRQLTAIGSGFALSSGPCGNVRAGARAGGSMPCSAMPVLPLARQRRHAAAVSDRSRQSAARRIGLALGGGAARGWAHIGVFRALDEAGHRRPTSSPARRSAPWSAAAMSRANLDDLEAFARGLTRRRVFGLLDLNFAGSGLISGNRLSKLLEARLSGTRIEDLPQRLRLRRHRARHRPRDLDVARPPGRGDARLLRPPRHLPAGPRQRPLAGRRRPGQPGAGLRGAAPSAPTSSSPSTCRRDVFGRGTVVQDHSAEPIAEQAIGAVADDGLATPTRAGSSAAS